MWSSAIKWLDVKYANLLGSQLEGFVVKTTAPYLANFRCPLCGDSQKRRRKKRGFILEKNGSLIFHCHNGCGAKGFASFLKEVNSFLFQEYVFERFKEQSPSEVSETKPLIASRPVFRTSGMAQFFNQYPGCRKVSSLPVTHAVRQYLEQRRIPSSLHWRFYCTTKYFKWSNTIVPDLYNGDALEHDEPRLVIPFLDKNGHVFAAQGRSLKKNSSLRYATTVFDTTKPLIYGLDSVDMSKPIYIFEGPIDSLFAGNSVAVSGSRLGAVLDTFFTPNHITTLVYDNEPRSPEICKNMVRMIDSGRQIVVWPSYIKAKDLNQMIIDGEVQPSQVNQLLKEHTFVGLEAILRFNQWKRI